MSNELENLAEEHGIAYADLKFIIQYIAKQSLTPQVIMRRISSFEKLKGNIRFKKSGG